MASELQRRDKNVVWHPYTQVGRDLPPIPVVRAEGALLTTEDGRTIIDAISSWWVTLHGHSHPDLARALYDQALRLEQVIFAGFTHEPGVTLAEKLCAILPSNQRRVFYTDDGSTAVEVALKIAIQSQTNRGEVKRKKILAFTHGYHGDTFGAMSVGGSGFSSPFAPYLFPVQHIPAPYPGEEESALRALHNALEHDDVLALIYEPIVQGAGGMKMMDRNGLSAILTAAKERGVLFIADEVFTGFGRTGDLFVSTSLHPYPDIITLSKGVTGGCMPLGVTTCTEDLFTAFISEDRSKALLHGHSFTGNPLACAVALESLRILLSEECSQNRERLSAWGERLVDRLRRDGRVYTPRSCGTIIAWEMKKASSDSYFTSTLRDEMYRFFIERGVLLRPLGTTLYVVPPYCITTSELQKIEEVVFEAIEHFSKETTDGK